jgi:hypothetical protein
MINEIEFFEKYKPMYNSNTESYIFETYGKDLENVLQIVNNEQSNFVWTSISCDNEDSYLIPGCHLVNREFYYICEIPWEDENIEVNCNKMITREQAIDAFINFWKEQGFVFDRYVAGSHFMKNEYSVGKAKYDGIELFEDLTSNDLTDEQQDLIHDFYSNLI